jgi:hypothetical protein
MYRRLSSWTRVCVPGQRIARSDVAVLASHNAQNRSIHLLDTEQKLRGHCQRH